VAMAVVRPALVGLSLLSCLASWSDPAQANTFSFGSTVWRSDLSVDTSSGEAEDQSTTQFSIATAFSANFRAQASADIDSFEEAEADVLYVWDVPYTITRNVSVTACCPGIHEATFPLQEVVFGITFSGAVGVDEFGGDEAAQIFDGITVESVGGLFADVVFNGASRANSDGATLVSGSDAEGYLTTVDFSGPGAGEVVFAVPTDYRSWQDSLPPYGVANGYNAPNVIVQSFTDTLRVSYRVRAQSLGDFSTGGEAIACAGLQSELDPFDLAPNCGNGLTISGAVGVFDSEVVPIPEPGTLLLLGAGLGGLSILQRRRSQR
jgi:hypothetical protein